MLREKEEEWIPREKKEEEKEEEEERKKEEERSRVICDGSSLGSFRIHPHTKSQKQVVLHHRVDLSETLSNSVMSQSRK